MAIGDLLFSMMGQPNPQTQLRSALGQGMGSPGSMAQAIASGNRGSPSNNSPQPNSLGVPGQPAESPQPQPQAYTSPPDLAQAYLTLMNRQQANAGINTGLGLIAAGLSHNQADRDLMVNSMTNLNQQLGAGGVGAHLGDIVQLQQMQLQRQLFMAQAQHLPAIAQQLNVPVDQVQMLWLGGGLNDVMKSLAEKNYEIGTPQYQANLKKTLSDVDLNKANVGKAVADTAAAQATTAKTIAETALPTEQAKNYGVYAQGEQQAGRTPMSFGDYLIFGPGASDPMARQYGAYLRMQDQSQPPANAPLASTGNPLLDIMNARSRPAMGSPTAGSPAVPAGAVGTGPAVPPAIQGMPGAPSLPPGLSPDQFAAATNAQKEAEATAAKASAEDRATALASISKAEDQVRHAQELADAIKADPSLNNITGVVAGRLPAPVSGAVFSGQGRTGAQSAENLEAKIEQLVGQTGVQAVDALKGGIGRILGSEYGESLKAQSRLHDRSVDANSYSQAIDDYMTSQYRMLASLYGKAGVAVPDNLKPYLASSLGGPNAAPPLKSMSSADVTTAKGLIQQYGRDAVIRHLQQNGYQLAPGL